MSEEGTTNQEETANGVQHDRDCHGNVSQREHSNEKVELEAYGQRRAGKPLYRGPGEKS